MVECSRGLVKLFGRMIPVPEEKGSGDGRGEAKDRCFEGSTATIKERDEEPPGPEEQSKQAAPSSIGNDEHRPSAPAEQETATTKSSDLEDGHNDACKRQDKNLKKPDKILPCPRCNSLDTKFCYYNNYNVNQPRHFCKKCQRYWTAGGAMRNVPVGAGRRRNKNAPAAFAHYRHMTISESSVQSLRPGAAELSYHPNGTILSFGCGMPPLCESVASAADSIAEKTLVRKRGDGIETSSGSPAICSSLREGAGITSQEPGVQNCHGYPQTNSCFNGSSWPYPCNSPTAIYAYWGCPPPGVWNVPWLPPLSSPPQGTAPPRLEPNLPLGKHSRDGTDLDHSSSDNSDAKQNARERCLWIPKSLRIDDLDEAARSSIWETVGIGNDRFGRISGEGLFKAFHPKADIKSPMNEKSQVLHSNPAALSRSLNFRESI